MAKPVNAAIGETWICCLICQSEQFRVREVKLNSFGLEFLKMAWADESATGLICSQCGYVHLFVNRKIQLYRVKT
ncbi:hypothetical protein J7I98_26615 [Streptomyces sp. ISL-98]|uniref:hypothetical protein n=1 Tax=Streptomyces sp. ISL-98 TaxID=2819192 RepID=UPI001BE9CD79|nr:hypothetical protein [Streptomyces sp. ISL-98]MBT2509388.1 hypothetical protein [Streptomyces sp. ISL-98]